MIKNEKADISAPKQTNQNTRDGILLLSIQVHRFIKEQILQVCNKVNLETSMQESKPGAKATQQAVDHSLRSRNTKVRSAAVPPPNECPTI